jgi:hypothetical protein
MLLPFSDQIALRSGIVSGTSASVLGSALLGMALFTLFLNYHVQPLIWMLTLFATTIAIFCTLFSLLLFAVFYLNRATSMRHSCLISWHPAPHIAGDAVRRAG